MLEQFEFRFFFNSLWRNAAFGFIEIHSGVEHFYAVVMWALCVAFVGLLDLHEFQLACWGGQQGEQHWETTTELKISNKSKANMRLNALFLLLRGVMGEDRLSPQG